MGLGLARVLVSAGYHLRCWRDVSVKFRCSGILNSVVVLPDRNSPKDALFINPTARFLDCHFITSLRDNLVYFERLVLNLKTSFEMCLQFVYLVRAN